VAGAPLVAGATGAADELLLLLNTAIAINTTPATMISGSQIGNPDWLLEFTFFDAFVGKVISPLYSN
jgi:hypothetical protein